MIKTFIQGFTLEKHMDLLCVTECHVLLRESAEIKGRDYAPIRLVFDELFSESRLDPLQSVLAAMDLVTSTCKIRHGLSLILTP